VQLQNKQTNQPTNQPPLKTLTCFSILKLSAKSLYTPWWKGSTLVEHTTKPTSIENLDNFSPQDFLPNPCTLFAKKAKHSGTNHQTNLHKNLEIFCKIYLQSLLIQNKLEIISWV
jgi:hypothetical protein